MRFQSSPLAFSRVIDGEWVILKQDEVFCYQLNETAGFLWENLKTPKTSGDLLKKLVENFDIKKEVAKKDLDSFLKSGVKNGFLVSKA